MAEIKNIGYTLNQRLANYKLNSACMKQIPKSVRDNVAACLSECVNRCIEENCTEAWEKLFCFAYCVLKPTAGAEEGKKNVIEKNIELFNSGIYVDVYKKNEQDPKKEETKSELANRCIEKYDLKGAYDLLFREKIKDDISESTRQHLEEKHPKMKTNIIMPIIESEAVPADVTECEIMGAIDSFPDDSASGIDGLSAKHLKDLCHKKGTSEQLMLSLRNLADFMIRGKVNPNVTKYLYGAHLIAIKKPDGSIRPIAVGNTIRRIVAKIVNKRLGEYVAEKMIPRQVGYGCKGGTDAAIHAIRYYIENNKNSTKVILKLDFSNAFNAVHRDMILQSIQNDDLMKMYYPYFFQTLATPSSLFFGKDVISSETGVQQGDPLGPMIFCWITHTYYEKLKSELCVWYTDDGTLSDDPDTVLNDLIEIMSWKKKLGLSLNISKCELCVFSQSTEDHAKAVRNFREKAPEIKVIEKKDLCMLGSPLTDEATKIELEKRIRGINNALEPLQLLETRHVERFLKKYTDILKIVHILRTCAAWKHPAILKRYDTQIKQFYTKISIVTDDLNWMKRTLPVKLGGLGIRLIEGLALSAYLASVHSGEGLIGRIYPKRKLDDIVEEPIKKWRKYNEMENIELPLNKDSQKEWDNPIIEQQSSKLELLKKENSL